MRSALCLNTVFAAFLAGCGGGGGDSASLPPTPAADRTAPVVIFSPSTLTVPTGETGASTLSATDNVAVVGDISVSCTNNGAFANGTFTAPDTSTGVTSVCTATARDAAGNAGTATLTVTVSPPPPDTTAPVVKFDPTTLTVPSEGSGTSILSATDDVGIDGDIEVICTNNGVFSDNTFTAPVAPTGLTSVCTAKAKDAATNLGTAVLTVTIEPANDAPVIISSGSFNTFEIFRTAYEPTVQDPEGDTLNYSIISGSDAALFDIDESTGFVTFKTSPDFEDPQDSNLDNTYEFVLSVSDGELATTQDVALSITDYPRIAGYLLAYDWTPTNEIFIPQNLPDLDGDGAAEFIVQYDGSSDVHGSVDSNVAILFSSFFQDVGRTYDWENLATHRYEFIGAWGVQATDVDIDTVAEKDFILRGDSSTNPNVASIFFGDRNVIAAGGTSRFSTDPATLRLDVTGNFSIYTPNPLGLGDLDGNGKDDFVIEDQNDDFSIIFDAALSPKVSRTLDIDTMPDGDKLNILAEDNYNRSATTSTDMFGDNADELIIFTGTSRSGSRLLEEGYINLISSEAIKNMRGGTLNTIGASSDTVKRIVPGTLGADQYFANVVKNVADIDGDGKPELFLQNYDTNVGRAGTILKSTYIAGITESITRLDEVPSEGQLVLNGRVQPSFATRGDFFFDWDQDFDGDGFADIMTGPFERPNAGRNRQYHLIFGRDLTTETSLDLQFPGDQGVIFYSSDIYCRELIMIPDVTGDGQGDFRCNRPPFNTGIYDGFKIKEMIDDGVSEIDLSDLIPLDPQVIYP